MTQYPEGSTMTVWYDEATELPRDVCFGVDLASGPDQHVEQLCVVEHRPPAKAVVRTVTAREAAWWRMRQWLGLDHG